MRASAIPVIATLRQLDLRGWVGGISGVGAGVSVTGDSVEGGTGISSIGKILIWTTHPRLDFVAISQRLIHRHFINIFQIAAHRHAHRDTGNEQAERLE